MRIFILSLLASAFLISSAAFAVNPSENAKDKAPTPKVSTLSQPHVKSHSRETRMRATGIVREITDNLLRIERSLTAELMEFYLEKPLETIAIGDKVIISYIKKEEKNIAKRVNKDLPQKKAAPSKPVPPALVQPPPPAK